MNISDAIAFGRERLQSAKIHTALADTKYLLRSVIERDPAFVVAHPEFELSAEKTQRFMTAIDRRSAHTPIQYIVGVQEFYGLRFRVTPDVLIPRPETEVLVEDAIARLRNIASPLICEVGTGSGCIAVSVSANLPHSKVTALDISPAALTVAAENAENIGVAPQITFLLSDVFSAVQGQLFDAILTNPPYVTAREYADLDREVRDFEPRTALTDGGDGLSIIRRIISGAPILLRPGGFLSIEVGRGQATEVRRMFESNDWSRVETLLDLQKIERAFIGTRNSAS